LQIQVAQVLGGVLADPQVANRHRRASARRAHALVHLHEPLRVLIPGELGIRIRVARIVVRILVFRVRVVVILRVILSRLLELLLELALLRRLLLELLRALEPVHDARVLRGVEAVVPVALLLEPEPHVLLHKLIRRDVGV
jgi:hypothetical protein